MPTPFDLVLVINCGSSSLKFTVLPAGGGEPLVSGIAECLGLSDARLIIKENGEKTTVPLSSGAHSKALEVLMHRFDDAGLLDRVAVVGHRVVHGGERFTESVLITSEVIRDIEVVSGLAPLHNPANLLGIRACLEELPFVPQVAVFDTAFHQTMPKAAYSYAVPQRFYRERGVRRYGFHGTSHRYVSGEAVRLIGLDPKDSGVVVAHLGNGASATAVVNGKSVDTSMGMTPLEGLVMGTRSGDLDFSAAAKMASVEGADFGEMEAILNRKSGLLGLSELSSDCRDLEAAAAGGHEGAQLALDVFVHRLARYIGALAASLPRFDALIFTGGIGENSVRIRKMTLEHLKVFGFVLDEAANKAAVDRKSGRIDNGSGPQAWVVPTDEEGTIAREATEIARAIRQSEGGVFDAGSKKSARRPSPTEQLS
ncbi:acetate/propionate family kinase [Burkholderia oklahomensis]|uniref:acetate/propionate family kinase n=1 Tax=Burkholderia oklahomensis TaxID=342113 RepID=UPI0005D9DC85|nr:acetate kinase [Burkholderia oklahomensis]AJX34112.1 acetate kinase [Burkholderia oklahomensis C6786]MBI0363273.1 acetate kinase [Burkholderia oklahomensis]SUY27384.1 Propionate kinase [Burkholderia oklahomensis]